MQRLVLLVIAGLAACYSPSFKSDIACDPVAHACPSGSTCGADNVCHRAGESDAPGGHTGADAAAGDARLHDAMQPDTGPPIDAPPPVGCTNNAGCATPPDLCSQPGTCNLGTHTCEFQPVDCSQLNSECSDGVCTPSTGQCAAMPKNGGQVCGAGQTCGAFGACGGFDSACDSTGTQSRSCTQHTCQAGACTANSFSDSQACSVTVGSCGSPTVTNCNACDYTSQCDEQAQQTCTCTTFDCSGGSCIATPTSCVQSCSRNTDGDACAPCVNFRMKECQNGLCATTDC